MNLNTAILSGSLTGDPAPGAQKHDLCTFTLSFDDPFTRGPGDGGRHRNFVSIVAFGRTAEACLKHLKKGSRVVVDGRIREDRWQSKAAGAHSRMTLICDRIHFVSGLKKVERSGDSLPAGARRPGLSPSGEVSSSQAVR
jgi:single-strand DNA-binding protein